MQSEQHLLEIRESVKAICESYGEDYWRKLDESKGYPTEFVQEITESGFLGCLIPEAYGGAGLGFVEACAILNAERILIGSECIGDARYFIEKATEYAKSRVVFGRPIGQNQGLSFPIATAYAQSEAAALMVEKAARLFDAGEPCASEANMAKMLAADASWKTGDTCLQTHGGFGISREYHIERKLRETRLYQIAPISTNLILSYLSEHVLGMPRSF